MDSASGTNLLMLKIEKGQLKEVQNLVKKYPNLVNSENKSGNTALNTAIRLGQQNVVKVLIQNKAKYQFQNKAGQTPIYIATFYEQQEILSYLIQQPNIKIDIPDKRGWTPLFVASHSGNTDLIKILLDNKSNFTLKSKKGESILDISKNWETIDFIIKNSGHSFDDFIAKCPLPAYKLDRYLVKQQNSKTQQSSVQQSQCQSGTQSRTGYAQKHKKIINNSNYFQSQQQTPVAIKQNSSSIYQRSMTNSKLLNYSSVNSRNETLKTQQTQGDEEYDISQNNNSDYQYLGNNLPSSQSFNEDSLDHLQKDKKIQKEIQNKLQLMKLQQKQDELLQQQKKIQEKQKQQTKFEEQELLKEELLEQYILNLNDIQNDYLQKRFLSSIANSPLKFEELGVLEELVINFFEKQIEDLKVNFTTLQFSFFVKFIAEINLAVSEFLLNHQEMIYQLSHMKQQKQEKQQIEQEQQQIQDQQIINQQQNQNSKIDQDNQNIQNDQQKQEQKQFKKSICSAKNNQQLITIEEEMNATEEEISPIDNYNYNNNSSSNNKNNNNINISNYNENSSNNNDTNNDFSSSYHNENKENIPQKQTHSYPLEPISEIKNDEFQEIFYDQIDNELEQDLNVQINENNNDSLNLKLQNIQNINISQQQENDENDENDENYNYRQNNANNNNSNQNTQKVPLQEIQQQVHNQQQDLHLNLAGYKIKMTQNQLQENHQKHQYTDRMSKLNQKINERLQASKKIQQQILKQQQQQIQKE